MTTSIPILYICMMEHNDIRSNEDELLWMYQIWLIDMWFMRIWLWLWWLIVGIVDSIFNKYSQYAHTQILIHKISSAILTHIGSKILFNNSNALWLMILQTMLYSNRCLLKIVFLNIAIADSMNSIIYRIFIIVHSKSSAWYMDGCIYGANHANCREKIAGHQNYYENWHIFIHSFGCMENMNVKYTWKYRSLTHAQVYKK